VAMIAGASSQGVAMPKGAHRGPVATWIDNFPLDSWLGCPEALRRSATVR
jgi:hypothetical protein